MRNFILALFSVITASSQLAGQDVKWSNRERAFSVIDENDALGGSSDSAYTQGIRFMWQFSVWKQQWTKTVRYMALVPLLERLAVLDTARFRDVACVAQLPRSDRPCGNASV